MSTYSIARSAARVLAQRFGVAVVVIAEILGVSRVDLQTARPAPENLPDVMATAAGTPPDHPGVDYSRAKVLIFADSLLKAETREVDESLHQIRTRCSGASHSLSPSFTPKAA
jgi:hypothetical protein